MPALAIADAMCALRSDVEPVLVGAERGVEARLLPERDRYRFHLLPAEPIYRHAWWKNAKWIFLLGRLMKQCRRILEIERPAFAVGTGAPYGPTLRQGQRRSRVMGHESLVFY